MPIMGFCILGKMWGLKVTDAELKALSKELGTENIDEFVPVPNREKDCGEKYHESMECFSRVIYWENMDDGRHGWACPKCGAVIQWG